MTSTIDLALLFLRLGVTAFGGPAAHVAMMRAEVVERRRWLTEAQFLDLVGAVNLIPGPNSTELAIHIGFLRGRWVGMLVAGLCFIVPAALLVGFLAAVAVRLGALPAVVGALSLVKPVLVAVVAQALWGLAKPALRTPSLAGVGAAALGLALLGADPTLLLFGAGVAWGSGAWWRVRAAGPRPLLILWLVAAGMALSPSLLARLPVAVSPHPSVAGVFLFFLKVGSVLYGSGYVLLAFLRDGLCVERGWLTEGQLLDAVAAGQVTPGPVFTTATFVGQVLGGPAMAAAATVGIFLPGFVFVALSGPWVPRLRSAPLTGAFLDGVNAASLGVMAAVAWQLGRASVTDLPTALVGLTAAVLLVRFRVNATWPILAAALLGAWLR